MTSLSPAEFETVRTETKVKGLPSGWRRDVVVRKNGISAGKTDVYYYSPCGKKFRSKPQIARFLGESADLSCFDFSRAGSPSEGQSHRRPRTRSLSASTCSTPISGSASSGGTNGSGGGGGGGGGGAGNIAPKRLDQRVLLPVTKPLSSSPLRSSGPIRRTCGVIKLPVSWFYPPSDDQQKDDHSVLDQKKEVAVNIIVQSLWERRLVNVKPYDFATGTEIAVNKMANGVLENTNGVKKASSTPISKPQSLLNCSFAASPSLAVSSSTSQPSSLATSNALHCGSGSSSSSASTLSTHQTQGQGSLSNGSPAVPVELSLPIITDSVLRAQEEKVRHIRRQLQAAEGISS